MKTQDTRYDLFCFQGIYTDSFSSESLELMCSPNSEDDDMARRLRSIQCTCGPIQWREGEGDYVCFCKYVEEHGLSQDRDTSRQRSCSPPPPLQRRDDRAANSCETTFVTSSIDFDGPSVPSELALPQAIACTQALARTARAMRRSDQRLIRNVTKVKSKQDEILRRMVLARLDELKVGNSGKNFCFCVNEQWYHFMQIPGTLIQTLVEF